MNKLYRSTIDTVCGHSRLNKGNALEDKTQIKHAKAHFPSQNIVFARSVLKVAVGLPNLNSHQSAWRQ